MLADIGELRFEPFDQQGVVQREVKPLLIDELGDKHHWNPGEKIGFRCRQCSKLPVGSSAEAHLIVAPYLTIG